MKGIDAGSKVKAFAKNTFGWSIPFLILLFFAKDVPVKFLWIDDVFKAEWIRFILFAIMYLLLCARYVAIYRQFSIKHKWPKVANNLALTVYEDNKRSKSKIPPVMKVEKHYFRIRSLGITISTIKDKREEIERALGGIYINAVVDAKDHKKGTPIHDCIDIYYSSSLLPSMITFADYHPNKFKSGYLVFGKSETEWIEFSYYDCRQIGIAGENGGGKTSFLLSLITQIVCTDSQQVIVIIDFKESYEFKSLLNLNHNIIYINSVEKAVTVLTALMDIHRYRAKLISDNGYENIYKANLGDKIRLDHVWVIVDEADDLIPDSDEAKQLIKKLCQLSRSTGIHPILATQRLSAKNMGEIKEQLHRQVSFKLNQPETSRLWMGDDAANKLPEQAGIAIVKRNGENVTFQALYIGVKEVTNYMQRNTLRISRTYEKLLAALNPPPAKMKEMDVTEYEKF
jgi:S-DNA-T family DNA segregation ATPase FtsK/SpoIIIE